MSIILQSFGALIEKVFFSKIKKTSTCWLYQGVILGNGYGQLQIERRHWSAHRFSYHIHVGEIPDGLYVLHRCDVKRCVNPDHLFLGTPLDNMRDKIEKGRAKYAVGTAYKTAKLNDASVREIRKDTRFLRVIAKDYGVTESVICEVKSRKLWRHVS